MFAPLHWWTGRLAFWDRFSQNQGGGLGGGGGWRGRELSGVLCRRSQQRGQLDAAPDPEVYSGSSHERFQDSVAAGSPFLQSTCQCDFRMHLVVTAGTQPELSPLHPGRSRCPGLLPHSRDTQFTPIRKCQHQVFPCQFIQTHCYFRKV